LFSVDGIQEMQDLLGGFVGSYEIGQHEGQPLQKVESMRM